MVVQTEPASLTDAFEELDLDETYVLSNVQTAAPASMIRKASSVGHGISCQIPGTPISVSTDSDVSLSGRFEFAPSVDVRIKISAFQLKEFKLSASGNLCLDLDAAWTVTNAITGSGEKRVYGPTQIDRFVFFAGPVPVVMTLDGEVKVGVCASVEKSGTIQVGFTSNCTAAAGAEYLNGVWSPIGTFDYTFVPHVNVSGTGVCSITPYGRPMLELKIYGVVGPYIDLRPYGKVSSIIDADPRIEAGIGITGNAGGKLQVLSKDLFELNLELFDLYYHDEGWTWPIAGGTPAVSYFAIHDGAASVSTSTVTLNNRCTGSPTHYMASESSTFSGASWRTYSNAPLLVLSQGAGTKTVHFKVKSAAGESQPVSDTILVDMTTVATPSFNPNGGTFTGSVDVTVSCATSGATIRYTTDGSTPSQGNGTIIASGQSVQLTSSVWLKAVAYKSSMLNSAVAQALFAINPPPSTVATPIFDPSGGTFTDSVDVTVSCATTGATVRYTMDGSTPSHTNGTIISSGQSVHLTSSVLLKAVAYKNGMSDSAVAQASFTINPSPSTVDAPSFDPNGGTFTGSVDVTVSCTTSGATIRYTIDGSTPSQTNGTIITSGQPVQLTSSVWLKAIAYKSGMSDSSVAQTFFTINPPPSTVATPSFNPNGGTFTGSVDVTVSCATSGATIRYTTDGSTPSQGNGTIIASGQSVQLTSSVWLKAIAYKSGMLDSAVAQAFFTINSPPSTVATPTFNPNGGAFTGSVDVAISCATTGAAIRYTTDGSSPSQSHGTVISSGQSVHVKPSVMLSTLAYKTGMSDSAIASAIITVASPAATCNAHGLAATGGAGKAWGYNYSGQLGDGTTTEQHSPVRVSALNGVTVVAAGYQHSLGLRSDGTVWAWGWNGSGELGNGTYDSWNPHPTPGQVTGLTGIIAVATFNHSLALRSDGTVWAWGPNNAGQVGDGTTQDCLSPWRITGLTSVVAVSVGGQAFLGEHSLAVKSNGTVWAWGDNSFGQLGDGSTTSWHNPVQVLGLTQVVAIAGGKVHSLAAKSDGTVWAWGEGLDGQLGDGTKTQHHSPVQVSGMGGVVAVAAGYYHSLALKGDGTVWAWGDGFEGQLGDGMQTSHATPVQVPGLTDVTAVAAGSYNSLAVKSDGTVWAWGENDYGQLGDGTTTQQNSPVRVQGLP